MDEHTSYLRSSIAKTKMLFSSPAVLDMFNLKLTLETSFIPNVIPEFRVNLDVNFYIPTSIISDALILISIFMIESDNGSIRRIDE